VAYVTGIMKSVLLAKVQPPVTHLAQPVSAQPNLTLDITNETNAQKARLLPGAEDAQSLHSSLDMAHRAE
jgi:hypothetical protein